MLEEKITNLRNLVFVKSILFILLWIGLFWIISLVDQNYRDIKSKIREAHTILSEMQIKLNEIKDKDSSLSEAIAKYHQILNMTEQARCAEYAKNIQQLKKLKTKYNLEKDIRITLSELFSKSNMVRNKATHIVSYDLKIEFDSHSIADAFSIFRDMMDLMPSFTSIYLIEINETETITPQNVAALHPNEKPSLIRGRLYVKMQDIALNK